MVPDRYGRQTKRLITGGRDKTSDIDFFALSAIVLGVI